MEGSGWEKSGEAEDRIEARRWSKDSFKPLAEESGGPQIKLKVGALFSRSLPVSL